MGPNETIAISFGFAIVPPLQIRCDRLLYSFDHAEVYIHMKKDIHPENYRMVIFHDNSSEERLLIGSTVETQKTDKWTDGNEYPLVQVDVTSASHPFYTGQEKSLDTAGRVDRFNQRQSKAGKKKGAEK
ncbi:MAG: large subunit ribosomal protein L31 [Candidatus Paceibacteria bacterium]